MWDIAFKLLVCISLFGFFFVGYGLTQLVGYRKIMCSCKARNYMEMRRRGIANRDQALNAPDLIQLEPMHDKSASRISED